MSNTPSASVISAFCRRQNHPGTNLENVAASAGITRANMLRLLDRPEPELLDRLFAAARRQRERYFDNRVFLYGFLYISTHCRNRCSFCFYRKDNTHPVRYRKSPFRIAEPARLLAETGVHLIDLTAGEDPHFYKGNGKGFDPVIDLVRFIKVDTGLPVMVSLGAVPDKVMDRFIAAGADWFACYQETHNRKLFEKLRPGQSYEARSRSKMTAKSRGMLVEEGLLCGVGETSEDLIHSFDEMSRLGADQIRMMTFVPQPGTPMQDRPPPSYLRELVGIALMRLAFPHLLIPASLDVGGLDGLRQRLDAGANVVTSLVPPGQGLAGVARYELDIEEGRRTVKGIAPTLATCNLAPASAGEYRNWIKQHKRAAYICDHWTSVA